MSDLERELKRREGQTPPADPVSPGDWSARQIELLADALRELESAPDTARFLAAMAAAGNPGTTDSLARRSWAIPRVLLGEKYVPSWPLGVGRWPFGSGGDARISLTNGGVVTIGSKGWRELDPERTRRHSRSRPMVCAFEPFRLTQGTLAATLADLLHRNGVRL